MIMKLGLAGGGIPTLNSFDIGDTRATVLIFAHNAGIDIQASTSVSPTLKAGHDTMPAIAFDTYNQTTSEISKTLNSAASDVDHTGAVWKDSTVRRLTPVECERLQGFPDNWTADQADSNRYKQMGNAVAVPVVQWIVERMTNANL
jgi:site-specific DNA-cytosine methylase